MKTLKNQYNKPYLRKHGNIEEITQGNWTGGDDGIPERGDS